MPLRRPRLVALTTALVAGMMTMTATPRSASAAPAAAGASAPLSLPAVERFQLRNGLEVLLIPNATNPYVEMQLVARAGSALDPAGQEGLAALTATMLTNGTPTLSEEEVARTLEAMGAELSAWADLQTFNVRGSVITLEPRDLERFQGLFVDVVRNATFPEDSLAKTRTLRLSALKRLADDHNSLANLGLMAALYSGTPRGRLSTGTLTTLPKLQRADLVAFRDRVVVPRHSVLAIGGSFDPQAMRAWVEQAFGDPSWGEGVCTPGEIEGRCAQLCKDGQCLTNPFANRAEPKRPMSAAGRGRTVLLLDRDDPSINQIQWRLGQDGDVTLLDPAWPAFRLGTHILGGDFTSRLNQVLRVKEGLTYGARFAVDFGGQHSGPMYVSTFVSPKDLGRAVELSLVELRGVVAQPPPEPELTAAKAKIINQFPFKFETVSDTLEQYLHLTVDGVPVTWLEGYTAALAAPTDAQVHQSLGRLDPDRMVLVAVGNRDLIPTLQRFGQVRVVKVSDFLSTGLETSTVAP